MNIFHKVTLKNLQRNKTRTLVTIIGIILSAAMLTAVTTFISSLQNYMLNIAIYSDGDWHGAIYSAPYEKIEELSKNQEVKDIFISENIGYALLENSKNDYKPYLFVKGADEKFISSMPVHLTQGRMPENSGEILLPEHLKTNGGVVYSLGDTLKLQMGDRHIDEAVLDQNNPLVTEESGEKESLRIREERSYTVVGFYERPGFEPYSAPGYTAITVMDDNAEDYSTDIYLKVNKPKEVYDFLKMEAGNLSYAENSDVLTYIGVSRHSGFYTVLYGLGSILIGLIIFGSISLIYNAFAISVSERTKQFGLLSSIGATKKQIKSSVFFEGLVLSAIGIPLGILSGITGIGVTLYILGDKLYSLSSAPVDLKLKVTILSVVAAAVLSIITVMISAWIPSKRAMRITAIDAIRQSKDIAVKPGKIRTSPLIYKIFGLEGMLAQKHFKRNRKRYRATIVSLFMSIVLFISASSFVSYLKKDVSSSISKSNYDIGYYLYAPELTTDGKVKEIKDILLEVEGVEKLGYVYYRYSGIALDRSSLTDRFIENYIEEGRMEDGTNPEQLDYNMTLYAVDDSLYEDYLKENNLDKATYMSKDNPVAIAVGKVSVYDKAKQGYSNFDIFKDKEADIKIFVHNKEKYDALSDSEKESVDYMEYTDLVPIHIGLITDKLTYGINTSEGDLVIMYPASVIEEILPLTVLDTVRFAFSGDDPREMEEKIILALEDNGLPSDTIYNRATSEETDRNMITIINVFSYGFIVLISLIAVANVFNTITTGIGLRRREFAMLKSVGMNRRGFNKMMNYECLLYGIKALFWGLPVSVGITYLIYRSINGGWEISFRMPMVPVIIAVFSVFAVVFASMLYSMSKIRKDNPIDALKNENL